jgi:hypothetical protein
MSRNAIIILVVTVVLHYLEVRYKIRQFIWMTDCTACTHPISRTSGHSNLEKHTGIAG